MLPASESCRLLAPGCECECIYVVTAVRAGMGTAFDASAAGKACKQLITSVTKLLDGCSCWQSRRHAVRKRDKGGVAQAPSLPADPTAAAEAVRKADAAMEALLVSLPHSSSIPPSQVDALDPQTQLVNPPAKKVDPVSPAETEALVVGVSPRVLLLRW